MNLLAAIWNEHGYILLFGLAMLGGVGAYVVRSFSSVKTSKRYDRVTGVRDRVVIQEKDPLLATEHDKMEGLLSRILPSFKATQRRLARTGIKVTTPVYLFSVLFISGLLSIFVPIPAVTRAFLPLIYFMGTHFFIDIVVLRILRSRYQSRLVKQMPEMVDYVVRGIVVGQSLEASLKDTAQSMEAPLGTEMMMIQRLSDFGIPISEALTMTANEVDLAEFDFFTAACNVQLESGGNLAEVLTGLSDLIRGREAMMHKIDSLAAEGKMSVIVLASLPVLIFFYLYMTKREYVEPMFSNEMGQLILAGAAVLVILGAILAGFITRVKM